MLYVCIQQTNSICRIALVQFIRWYDDLFCEHFQLSLLRFHRELADIPFDMQTQWPWDITGRPAPGVSKRRDMRDLLITFSNAENGPKRCQYLIWPKMGSKNTKNLWWKQTLISPLIFKKQPAFSKKHWQVETRTMPNSRRLPIFLRRFLVAPGNPSSGHQGIPPVGTSLQVESTTSEGGTDLRPASHRWAEAASLRRVGTWFYRFCQQAVCLNWFLQDFFWKNWLVELIVPKPADGRKVLYSSREIERE